MVQAPPNMIPGIGKARFVRLVYCHQQELGCFTIEPFPNLYPERVQYLEDYRNQEVWVQTWNVPRGVNRVTGAKLNTQAPRLYKISKGNKIKVIIKLYTGASKAPDRFVMMPAMVLHLWRQVQRAARSIETDPRTPRALL